MIGELKRKMLLTIVLGLLMIFAGVVAAINLANTAELKRQVQASLEILVGNNTHASTQTENTVRRDRSGLPEVRASTLSRVTDYCVIRLNKAGEMHEWKSESTDEYNEEIATALARQIMAEESATGRIGQQAFRRESRSYGTLIVVMDVSTEIGYAQTLLRITVIVGVMAWALLSLLAWAMLRRVLQPVQEAFTKQQQFIWDASHELKTPMAVISANTQVLERELGDNPYFDNIRNEVKHADDLVQNLLTLARLDTGRQNVTFSRFDLGSALLTLALPMESLAYEEGKTLELRLSSGIFCMGNETLITQLISVLLSNALKYTPAGGCITLSLEAKGRRRLIRVHNTGSYIAPEERRRIFDRFYRTEEARETQNGSGIGLAIAMSIARIHHGEILVDSDMQQGTMFTVVLYDYE